ncbi:hypothetical protein F5878DRAFT_633987 [Lentinula raphanica]|uniref:Uncharacterized protein n=1 Tax=Lentinula raphanica TaxID=153919 RepID=A0AA38NYB7_9AGAR|nr:hypothetical protein F5878DRAFT_633987 [Lentinula raphanica]
MTRSSPTHFTPTQVIALSSGVLATPTAPPMNSGLSSTGVARPEGQQSCSFLKQGSLLDVQHRGVEHVSNLVPRAPDPLSDEDMMTNLCNVIGPETFLNILRNNHGSPSAAIRDMILVPLNEAKSLLETMPPAPNTDAERRRVLGENLVRIPQLIRIIQSATNFVRSFSNSRFAEQALPIAQENYLRALAYFPPGKHRSDAEKAMRDARGAAERQSHGTPGRQ